MWTVKSVVAILSPPDLILDALCLLMYTGKQLNISGHLLITGWLLTIESTWNLLQRESR
jgi:hypothetical protein